MKIRIWFASTLAAVTCSVSIGITPAAAASCGTVAYGSSGPCALEVQRHLVRADFLPVSLQTGKFLNLTRDGVRRFQAANGLVDDGVVGSKTWPRLRAAATRPLPAACVAAGRVLCISKRSSTMRIVDQGSITRTFEIRTGDRRGPGWATKTGTHTVLWKSRNHVSSSPESRGAAMPFSLFFYQGQAVHYSPDFAARGHGTAASDSSHGCVNMHDKTGAQWLFDTTKVGTRVVVYA